MEPELNVKSQARKRYIIFLDLKLEDCFVFCLIFFSKLFFFPLPKKVGHFIVETPNIVPRI